MKESLIMIFHSKGLIYFSSTWFQTETFSTKFYRSSNLLRSRTYRETKITHLFQNHSEASI